MQLKFMDEANLLKFRPKNTLEETAAGRYEEIGLRIFVFTLFSSENAIFSVSVSNLTEDAYALKSL